MNQSAIQQHKEPRISGTVSTAAEANAIIEWALEFAHFVGPATSIGVMPIGCGMSFSKVYVDLSRDDKGRLIAAGEIYKVGDRWALGKSALDKIAAGLGLSWDPYLSGRVDDARDPYLCEWQAVGKYKAFDGTEQVVVKHREVNLRKDSPLVEGLYERYEAKAAAGAKGDDAPKDPTGQIREMRMHILSHAESKAQLRVVRTFLRASYTLDELVMPFVTCRLMYTGRVPENPALEEKLALNHQRFMLGGTAALYGGERPQLASTRRPSRKVERLEADVHDTDGVDLDEELARADMAAAQRQAEREPIERQPAQQASQPAQQQAAAERAQQTSQQAEEPAQQPRGRSAARNTATVPTMPFGLSKGLPITEAPSEHVEWMIKAITEKLASGEAPRFAADNKRLLDALEAETKRRATGDGRQGQY